MSLAERGAQHPTKLTASAGDRDPHPHSLH
jgi:hypothetical protein